VPPGDPAALADALTFLVDDRDTARRMGEAGRKRILEAFSVQRLMESIERVYWEALS